jgi:hypothetical protein
MVGKKGRSGRKPVHGRAWFNAYAEGRLDAWVKRLEELAAQGNERALTFLIEQYMGKARLSAEVSGPDQGPAQTVVVVEQRPEPFLEAMNPEDRRRALEMGLKTLTAKLTAKPPVDGKTRRTPAVRTGCFESATNAGGKLRKPQMGSKVRCSAGLS